MQEEDRDRRGRDSHPADLPLFCGDSLLESRGCLLGCRGGFFHTRSGFASRALSGGIVGLDLTPVTNRMGEQLP